MKLCTGYVDSQNKPIHLDDYMESEDEYFFGQVVKHKNRFILSYGDTFDTLKNVANKYHLITENYANLLLEYKIQDEEQYED